jgi:hypothetical protein
MATWPGRVTINVLLRSRTKVLVTQRRSVEDVAKREDIGRRRASPENPVAGSTSTAGNLVAGLWQRLALSTPPQELSGTGFRSARTAILHPDEGGGLRDKYQSENHRDEFGQIVSSVAHRPHGCF